MILIFVIRRFMAMSGINAGGTCVVMPSAIYPTAFSGGSFSPSLDFSDSRNSQYVGLFGWL